MSQPASVEDTAVLAKDAMHKYLCFVLDGKSFAVNILKVKELIEHIEVTSIPMMPTFLWGAINLRGRVVPVVDLSARLGMDSTELRRRTCFVIIEMQVNGVLVDAGIVVDAVSQVADIPPDSLEPAPSFGGNINNEFIDGIGKVNDQFVLLLNVDKALSMEDIAAFQQASPVEMVSDVTDEIHNTAVESEVTSDADLSAPESNFEQVDEIDNDDK